PHHAHGVELGRDHDPVVRADRQRGASDHDGGQCHGHGRLRLHLHRQGQGGVYKLTFTAANALGSAVQSVTLTVNQASAITSAPTASATHGHAFSFRFTAAGYPLANVTHTGTVRGLTYTNNGNGTATLSGTPATAGTYALTITARNSVGSATQTFTLTVT